MCASAARSSAPYRDEVAGGLVEHLLGRFVCPVVEGSAKTKKQLRSVGVVWRRELEGSAIEARGGLECVQSDCTVSGFPERSAGAVGQQDNVLTCRARVLERCLVVVGEHLGVILLTAERLDPLCSRSMLLGSLCSRHLLVGDFADERVAERVLVLVGDRASATSRLTNSFRSSECRRSSSGRRSSPSAPSQKTRPTTAASWSSSFSSRGRVSRRAAMMPWTLSGRTTSPGRSSEHPRELLGIERVPARVLEKTRLQVGLDR